ncbi:Lipopolysaccharide export system ATP-binding protein LptB [compost metagenome]
MRLRDSGLAIVLVEHDMGMVMGISDQVVVMNFGKRIAHGTPSEVQRNPAVIEAYLGQGFGVQESAPAAEVEHA